MAMCARTVTQSKLVTEVKIIFMYIVTHVFLTCRSTEVGIKSNGPEEVGSSSINVGIQKVKELEDELLPEPFCVGEDVS